MRFTYDSMTDLKRVSIRKSFQEDLLRCVWIFIWVCAVPTTCLNPWEWRPLCIELYWIFMDFCYMWSPHVYFHPRHHHLHLPDRSSDGHKPSEGPQSLQCWWRWRYPTTEATCLEWSEAQPVSQVLQVSDSGGGIPLIMTGPSPYTLWLINKFRTAHCNVALPCWNMLKQRKLQRYVSVESLQSTYLMYLFVYMFVQLRQSMLPENDKTI